MSAERERLLRRFDACVRAFNKLYAMHYRVVDTELKAWCIGRRIMRAVRRVRIRARGYAAQIRMIRQ